MWKGDCRKTAQLWRWFICFALVSQAALALGLHAGPRPRRTMTRFERLIADEGKTSTANRSADETNTTTWRSRYEPFLGVSVPSGERPRPDVGLASGYNPLLRSNTYASPYRAPIGVPHMDYSSSELPSVPEETDEEYAERLQKWVDSAATHLGTAKAQATRDEELTDETGLWEGHSFSKPMPSAITADEEPGGARQEEELSPHPRSSAITAKEKQRAAGQDNDLSPEPAPSAGTGEEEQGRGGQDNDLSSELAPSRGTGEEEQGRAGREALPTVSAIPITEAQEGTRQDSQLSARHSPTGTDGGPHVEVSEEKGDLNGLESDQQNGTPTVIQQSRDQSAAARQQVVACLDKLQSAPTAVDPKKVCGGAKNGSFDKCVERVTHWIQSGSLDCLLVNFEVEAAGGRSLTVVLPENASEFLYFARLYQVLKRGPCRDLPNETEFGRAVAASMYTTPEALGRWPADRHAVKEKVDLLLANERLARLLFHFAHWLTAHPVKLSFLNQACRVHSLCRRLVSRIMRPFPLGGEATPPPATVKWFESFVRRLAPRRGSRVAPALASFVAQAFLSSLPRTSADAAQTETTEVKPQTAGPAKLPVRGRWRRFMTYVGRRVGDRWQRLRGRRA